MITPKATLLEEELAFYDENKEEFLHKHANRHLLIEGQTPTGHFSTMDQAVGEGVRQFRKEPFLVGLAGTETPTFTVPMLALGLLCQSGTPELKARIRTEMSFQHQMRC